LAYQEQATQILREGFEAFLPKEILIICFNTGIHSVPEIIFSSQFYGIFDPK